MSRVRYRQLPPALNLFLREGAPLLDRLPEDKRPCSHPERTCVQRMGEALKAMRYKPENGIVGIDMIAGISI
jgi:uncharacterized protein YdhG (YjbR/CyaY superfamily)